LLGLTLFLPPTAAGSERGAIWYDVYRELNPNETGEVQDELWLHDIEAWAIRERTRLEPIVLRILKGEQANAAWTRALSIARVIPTPSIRDTLVERLQELASETPDGCFAGPAQHGGSVAVIVTILGSSGDDRVREMATYLASRECQPALVVERCVEALQHIGGKETLARLRQIPLRQRYDHIDRLCRRAEKIIEARVEGRDLFAGAVDQLRDVNVQFVRAVEDGNYESFASIQPFGFRAGVDVEEFQRKFKPDDPEIADIVRAMKSIAGTEQFDIDRDEYQATVIIEGRYKFTYVLEVDGWKIFGPVRVGR